jgi:hypothetical protein
MRCDLLCRSTVGACSALVLLACGSSPGEVVSPNPTDDTAESSASAVESSTPAPSAAKQDAAEVEVPSTCETKGKACLPNAAFVKKFCQNVHPDVALAFFKKGTPFTRGYLKGNTDAFNGYGGVSSGDKLVFDEEVIVLSTRENTTGIEVSGAGGQYDLLRWDGSCATVPMADVTFSVPPAPKTPRLDWKVLSDELQAALLNNAEIAKINKERRSECKGASMGDVSKKCVKLVDQLSAAVVNYVRTGEGTIPVPAKVK